jgi:adenylate kinase
MTRRVIPNFFLTVTPGVGKTTLAAIAAEQFNLFHVPISRLISENHLFTDIDSQRDCTIYDDEKLDPIIDDIISQHPEGGIIFDFHYPDAVSSAYIDYFIILRTESDILYRRLEERNYLPEKITENVDAEIHRVILDEVEDEEEEEKIRVLQSDTEEDMNGNVQAIGNLIQDFSSVYNTVLFKWIPIILRRSNVFFQMVSDSFEKV